MFFFGRWVESKYTQARVWRACKGLSSMNFCISTQANTTQIKMRDIFITPEGSVRPFSVSSHPAIQTLLPTE